MRFKLPVKTNRILLPFGFRKNLIGRFFLVDINKSDKKSSFLYRMTKDERIIIPKHIRSDLRLKCGDMLGVGIKTVRNMPRTGKMLSGDVFNTIHYVPEKTISGYEILATCNCGNLLLWYSAKGRPNEVEIKKFALPEFSRFLGYYQAEGGKVKLSKRRGRELSITNKSFKIIEDSVSLSGKFFDRRLWKATIVYNGRMADDEIEKLKYDLSGLGIRRRSIHATKGEDVREYTIKIWITNSILAETIFNFSNKVRKHIVSCNLDASVNMEVAENFLRGLIAGDGNLNVWRDRKGSLHKRLQIFETNRDFIEDYSEILRKFGISGRISKDKIKRLYTYSASLNWNALMRIKNSGLLLAGGHMKKLETAIREQRRFRNESGTWCSRQAVSSSHA